VYFLVRKQTGRGSAEALDTEYQGDTLSLGGDSNVMVQLPGVGGSVQLSVGGKGQMSASARGLSFEHNGKSVKKAKLALGDTLVLPGYELEIIEPPQGFGLALVLRATAALAYGKSLDIDQSAWSVRRYSWLFALLVLVVALLFPLAGVIQPPLAKILREAPLPDDGLWSSGPLAAAHRTSGIAADCQACHTTPFVMVQDQACLACHRSMTEHVDITGHPEELFTGQRCASCHREHNEPAQLVQRDKGLCVDCHAQPDDWPAAEDMSAVHAFTGEGHPEFRIGLLVPQGGGGALTWELQRVLPGAEPIQERSNLKFTHAVHLDSEKVQNEATGDALVCDSCHTAKDDGEHFEPVTMDQHCRSCHGLSFDSFEPELELPHGDLRAAIVAMEAHFIREFTDPALRKERAGKKLRRVPGHREAAASCQGTGLDCGRVEAMKEAEFQFAETGCITCHQVTDTGLSDISDRWYVQPIRITGDWYPGSRFSHFSHLNLSWDNGAEDCEGCHDASQSDDSKDVLIPGQDNCLSCHGEDKSLAAVECVSCHAFHRKSGSAAVVARDIHAAAASAKNGADAIQSRESKP